MSIDMTQVVIAALPSRNGGIEPSALAAPAGMTYQWANTTILGDADLQGLSRLLDNGWTFVPPGAHPATLAMTMADAIKGRAFCLMTKSTEAIAEQRAKERARHMDLDMRVLSVLKRYSGEDQVVRVGGVNLSVAIAARNRDGTPLSKLHTLDEVRAELARYGFPPADIRLSMQRHFRE